MTNIDFSFNQITNQTSQKPKKHRLQNIQNYLQEHRPLAIGIFILVTVIIVTAIGIIIFSSKPNEPTQEPEKAPYLTFQNENLLEYPILGDDLIFNLSLILLKKSEMNSAPSTNPDGENYIISIQQESSNFQDNQDKSTFNIDVSDGRKYILQLLMNYDLDNEYAVAILDRSDKTDAQDYVIAFTNPTREYYLNLSNGTSIPSDDSSITDHLTGIPLNPLPESAINWMNSLNLTNPEIIHATMPGSR